MVSARARSITISGIRKMFEGAPPGAINFGLGEPDFEPPAGVREALCEAVRNGQNHYGPSAGLPALRARVAEEYHSEDGRTGPESVVITQGGSEALAAVALTLYDAGDEVLVPDPGFVLYAPHARIAGAMPVPYPLREEQGWAPDLDAIRALVGRRTRAIVVNSPGNPTGNVLGESAVRAIVDLAEEHDLWIVSDEVYRSIAYAGVPPSFWGRSDRVVVAQSFSKRLAITGWRLGFVLAPEAVAREVNKMHYHLVACPSTPAQVAVLAGLEGAREEMAQMAKEFAARRALVLRGLRGVPGVSVVPPKGAFYAFPRIDWGVDSAEAAQALLRAGLITTPGIAFGRRGEGHLRISFAAGRAALREGLGRLRGVAEEFARR